MGIAWPFCIAARAELNANFIVDSLLYCRECSPAGEVIILKEQFVIKKILLSNIFAHMQQHTISTRKRIFLRNSVTKTISIQRRLEQPTFGFMPNALPLQLLQDSYLAFIAICRRGRPYLYIRYAYHNDDAFYPVYLERYSLDSDPQRNTLRNVSARKHVKHMLYKIVTHYS